MLRCPDESDTPALYAANTQATFWRPMVEIAADTWVQEAAGLASDIPGAAEVLASRGWPGLMCYLLGEGQLGTGHWTLSRMRRTYYRYLRPIIPSWLKPLVRGALARRQCRDGQLLWPVEGRYADLQFRLFAAVLRRLGRDSAPYVHFWPWGRRYSLVLTHDVEGEKGQAFVRRVADLEESYGLRSSFNFVPEDYSVDDRLLAELCERGFEVGVHGLSHDGQLYRDWDTFLERADRINEQMRRWRACGFRSPLMHRQPQWLQVVDAEYDCSFFDTDPYEPIPGGTMSVWPFFIGRLVELPYTLVQDHTLTQTLGEQTPRLWFQKLAYLRRHCGMALMLTHPDYLRDESCLRLYEHFLRQVVADDDYWNAVPSEVARWWRCRAQAGPGAHSGDAGELEVRGAVLGDAVVVEGENGPTVRLDVPSRGRAMSGLRVVRSL